MTKHHLFALALISLTALASCVGAGVGSDVTAQDDHIAVCQEQSDMARNGKVPTGRIAISCPAHGIGDFGGGFNGAAAHKTSQAKGTAGTRASVADLFRGICVPHEGNLAAAVTAARATGVFQAPTVSTTGSDGQRTSLLSSDGRIEAIIVANDPLGNSCAVGSRNEVYIIGPNLRIVP